MKIEILSPYQNECVFFVFCGMGVPAGSRVAGIAVGTWLDPGTHTTLAG